MKCYIQNGYNKVVLTAGNYNQAVIKTLKDLIRANKQGKELAELSPITFASQCGFMEDIQKSSREKEFDEIKMFRTAKIFDAMGRKDIGRFIRKHEKSLPKENRKLIEAL